MKPADLAITDLEVRAQGRVLLALPALAVPQGTALGVRGPSGAGKTTFLNALSGLVPVQGRLIWGETDIARMGTGARARFRRDRMGMIFQDFLLFEELSALDNAAIMASFVPRAGRGALRGRAAALLDRLGLEALHHARADRLSGGERQRVATARALAHEPAILLADEPTASLDRPTADALIADLVDLARSGGRTVIAVSHDEAVLARMDRVITLRDGGLIDG